MLAFNTKLSWRGNDRTGRIDDTAVAGNKGALRMFADTTYSCVQGIRKEPVVGVEKNEKLTAAVLQPRVAGARETGIFLINIAHPGMAPHNFLRVVGGAIVNDDDLDIWISLPQYALNRLI